VILKDATAKSIKTLIVNFKDFPQISKLCGPSMPMEKMQTEQ
jgi:hypothetical protein